MWVIEAKASEADELGRQFSFCRLDSDLELRPTVEAGFTRQHQLAIGQARLDCAELSIGESAVLPYCGCAARIRAIASAPPPRQAFCSVLACFLRFSRDGCAGSDWVMTTSFHGLLAPLRPIARIVRLKGQSFVQILNIPSGGLGPFRELVAP